MDRYSLLPSFTRVPVWTANRCCPLSLVTQCGPLYTAEISPKQYRGALVTITELSINIGILLGYVAGYAFSGLAQNVGWRWMLGIGAFPPFLVLLGPFTVTWSF